MEQLRARAALEHQVRPRIAALAILGAGLAALAPCAPAHGGLFLCARVSLGDDGLVALELTADHEDNPVIADAEEARTVLRDALSLCLDDRCVPLEQLGALRFEARDRYGDDSPMPLAGNPGPHHLVVAHWQARLPGRQVAFAAKESTPLDVVLWRAGEVPAAGRSRWTLLIAGERSQVFTLSAARLPAAAWPTLGLALLAGLSALAWSRARRPPASARRSAWDAHSPAAAASSSNARSTSRTDS
jgi:hypothetical protein